MSYIEAKILNKMAIIAVVGLGYVGLPLAVEKAKAGYKVIGFDIQEKRVDLINQGVNYIGDIVDADLKGIVDNGLLSATTDYSNILKCDAVMICVPTPLDKYHQPDISYVKNSCLEIKRYLRKGMLIVLESTTYPGTTREIVMPILESTGLKCGQDFYLAFSPERVDPGNKLYNTKNTPKVVGGITEKCTEMAAALYENVLEGEIHRVSSPEVAEMEKILENTYRNVNIALVNEIAILCDKMKIDIWEVIDAAKTKPYGFQAFYPGPGLGGHCIPIDPFYLTWKAREFDFHTRLIEVAGDLNSKMPEYTVERCSRILNSFKKPLADSKILLLGIAYKQDVDDMRESPALKVLEILEQQGARTVYHDPHIDFFDYNEKKYQSVSITKDELESTDLVIVTTAHSNIDYKFIIDNSKIIFDTKNVLKSFSSNNIVKL